MTLGNKIRSKFVYGKMFYQRALGYVSIVNSALILFLFLSSLEKYGIDIELQEWFIPIILLTIVIFVTVGYFEDKLGFWKEEQRVSSSRNPQISLILAKLEKIEKRLDEL